MGSLFQTPLTSFTEQRARPGVEPGTSRTQSENHTPRPTSHAGTLFNAFLQQVFRSEQRTLCRSSVPEQRARPGVEPGTSRTQSENHTPRPTSHAGTLFNAFLQQVFTLLKHQYRSAEVDQITLPATVNEFHRTKGSSGI